MRCCGAIEIDNIDADRRGEARRRALAVDTCDQVVNRQLLLARDVLQGFPHHRLEADARPVTRDDHVADHQRGWGGFLMAGWPPRICQHAATVAVTIAIAT